MPSKIKSRTILFWCIKLYSNIYLSCIDRRINQNTNQIHEQINTLHMHLITLQYFFPAFACLLFSLSFDFSLHHFCWLSRYCFSFWKEKNNKTVSRVKFFFFRFDSMKIFMWSSTYCIHYIIHGGQFQLQKFDLNVYIPYNFKRSLLINMKFQIWRFMVWKNSLLVFSQLKSICVYFPELKFNFIRQNWYNSFTENWRMHKNKWCVGMVSNESSKHRSFRMISQFMTINVATIYVAVI